MKTVIALALMWCVGCGGIADTEGDPPVVAYSSDASSEDSAPDAGRMCAPGFILCRTTDGGSDCRDSRQYCDGTTK